MRRRRNVISVGIAATLLASCLVIDVGVAHALDVVMPARAILLKANDLAYDAVRGVIYASVPEVSGTTGNSIATIDPATGAVVSSVYAGSDPNKLALSDDASTLYVGLNGANAVRQFSLPGMNFVRQFSLGSSTADGPRFVEDIDVMPGHPETVAVARQNVGSSAVHEGVAIFDNGVQRPLTTQTFSGSDEIVFGSPTRIYGLGTSIFFGFHQLAVSAAGVTEETVTPSTFIGGIQFDGGRVYVSDGHIVDPASGTVIASLTEPGDFRPFAIDGAAHRAYYLYATSPDLTQRLHVFDTVSFAEVATYTIAGFVGTPTVMMRWGIDGLAIATTDGRVFLASPGSTAVTPPPIPTPVVTAYPYKVLDQVANDLVDDPVHDRIYAMTGAATPTNPNAVVEIDPTSATITRRIPGLDDPRTLAISDDGNILYAGVGSPALVHPFALPGLFPIPPFSIGPGPAGTLFPGDIAVMPGHPLTIAVTSSPGFDQTAIFDNGIRRPTVPSPLFHGSSRLAFGSPTELYGLSNTSTGDLESMSVDASGVTTTSESRQLLEEGGGDIQYAAGVVYAGSGRAADPLSLDVLGTMGGPFNKFVVDPVLHREYVIRINFGFNQQLQVYDTTTFRLLETYSLPNFSGPAISLTRWGANGLAFATADGPIYILSKDFASPPVVPPTVPPTDPPPADPLPPVELGAFGEYTAVPPTRLLDTRINPGPLSAGGTIDVQIEGAAGVPSSDVVAVVLNVTATGPQQAGFLTVWPSDEDQPLISNVNYSAGQTVPNLVTVAVSLEGAVRIFSSTHADVVVDIEGYYSDSLGTPGGRFHSMAPKRLFDTRLHATEVGAALTPGATRRFTVTRPLTGVPATVTAVVMNVTVTRTTASGFLTLYPEDSTVPLVSNLNFVANQTVPNLVIVKVPRSGVINLYNSAGNTDVIADIVGYYDADRTDESGRFIPFSPERVYDSRETTADHIAAPLGPGESLTFLDDLGASAYVFNVTVTEPTSPGYLTVYPSPGEVPLASNLNFVANQTVANLVYAPTGPDVGFFNSAGNSHMVLDLFGAFT